METQEELSKGKGAHFSKPRKARIPPLMRRTCLHGEWLHTPCKQCYEATGSEIHRLVCGPDPDGEKGYPPQQQATEEKKYILQPSIGVRCPKCKQPPLLLCPENMTDFTETAFFVCFGCQIIGQVGVGPVGGLTATTPELPQEQVSEEKECTYGPVHRFLDKMLACDEELYERILDTPGFAYWFNQLCLLAKTRCGGSVRRLTSAKPDVASCRSGRNGVYLQPIGTHDDDPFESPRG